MNRLTSTILRLVDSVERNQPIDISKEATLQALETVYAGQYFTEQALARDESAQTEWEQTINEQIE